MEGGNAMKPAVFLYGVPGQYGNYAAALEAAGARVVLCRDLYRSLDCDGLLLPGGGDIRGPLPGTETFLVDSFVRSRRPILGICRGMQALNVYWGGTLRDISGHQLPRGDMVHPTRAEGIMRNTPSTRPRPARRMGTMASFFPVRHLKVPVATGVLMVTSARGRSRVAS